MRDMPSELRNHKVNSTKPAVFATTHWSVVLAAGETESPRAVEALEKLCRG